MLNDLSTHDAPTAPLLLDLTTAAERLGVGRSTIYGLLNSGDLASVKIGRRRLIADAELRRFADELTSGTTRGAA